MSNKIKYQGKIYILESEVDDKIKEKVIEKAEMAIDEVFEEGGDSSTELPPEPTPEDQPFEGVSENPELDGQIEAGISALETALGITIDETSRMLLGSTIGDILATNSAPTDVVPPGEGDTPLEAEAPEMVLHEGRLFRKVGPVSDYMKKPLKESTETNAPKAIRVAGKVFVLAESQDLSKIIRK